MLRCGSSSDSGQASVSANATSDPHTIAERAVAMARVSPEDPYQGLVDPARLMQAPRDLDLVDATEVRADALLEAALAMEEAALAVNGVRNSGGASAGCRHGRAGAGDVRRLCRPLHAVAFFSRSVSVIAGEGTAMERDYDYSMRLHQADLEAPEVIGLSAGERAVRPAECPQGQNRPGHRHLRSAGRARPWPDIWPVRSTVLPWHARRRSCETAWASPWLLPPSP